MKKININMLEKKSKTILQNKLKERFSNHNVIIYDFNYKKYELSIGFDFMGDCNLYEKIIFSKKMVIYISNNLIHFGLVKFF